MSSLQFTAFSAVHPVGLERGVVLAICEGTETIHMVRVMQANGLHLKALGVLTSLLRMHSLHGAPAAKYHGRRLLTEAELTVVVDPEIFFAVEEVCSTGKILLPEATESLTAIALQVSITRKLGGTVTFTAGLPVLSAAQVEDMEEMIVSTMEAEADHQARLAAWALPEEDAAWVRETGATVVYTDGSCVSKTGFTAWAWFIDENRQGSGTVAGTASSYIERRAALEALRAVDGPVLLVSDFDNLVPEVSCRVLAAREARVVKTLRRMVSSRQVRILAVKGHAHCPGNIAVDNLAGVTLKAAWSKIAEDPQLVERLTSLTRAAEATLKEARQVANERRNTHERLYNSRALRKARKARFAARTAKADKQLVAA